MEVAGRQGFTNFEQIVERAREMGLSLALQTVYRFAANANWTRETLDTIVRVLDCDPREILTFEEGGDASEQRQSGSTPDDNAADGESSSNQARSEDEPAAVGEG